MLEIYAGARARQKIQQDGFNAAFFKTVLGASGGPKWFVLTGLDRVLFPEFLQPSKHHVNVVGSSAGAFRAACMAQNNVTEAINRLAYRYSHTVYSNKPTAREITQKGHELLDYVLAADGVEEILNNPRCNVHIIASRCYGLLTYENRWAQYTGLLASSALNAIGRRHLQNMASRAVFYSGKTPIRFTDPYEIKTEHIALNSQNIKDALMASGAIPVLLEGVQLKDGQKPTNRCSGPAVYRDGGIVDYHFDLNFGNANFANSNNSSDDLVLYPHFQARPLAGWFDKQLSHRWVHTASYNNVVMLVPSAEYVASLPGGKIPDRKDFTHIAAPERIKRWQRAIAESDRLADTFLSLLGSGKIVDQIKPLPFLCY